MTSIVLYLLVFVLFYTSNFLSNINNQHHERLLAKSINLSRKVVRISEQLGFLHKSKEQGTLPNGVATQMKFTPSFHDPVLKAACDEIMYDAGSRILDTFIYHYRHKSTMLRTAHYSLLNKLKNTIDENTYNSSMTHVRNKIHSENCNVLIDTK